MKYFCVRQKKENKCMIVYPPDKKIILFDGVCNLCNTAVLKVIQHDLKNRFVFCPLQSEAGQQIRNSLKIDAVKLDSLILYTPGISYEIKANAFLQIMNDLGGFWKLTQIFWILPEVVRNHLYDCIAKNRYRWFGKKQQCMRPTPELNARFLETALPKIHEQKNP